MNTSEFEIMLSIMQEIRRGNEPKAKDFGLTQNAFWEIVKECQNAGYITGAAAATGGHGDKALVVFLNHTNLTDMGLQCLEKNKSLLQQATTDD